jgi:KaiC/GvpD/RAD55 family RecA-like ATPase
MYRKEVNERSPMRVFEKSMHGGLGRGNVGVLAARAGVGKTALLVQIALDDLLRGRKVLHISHLNTVDHVRSFYDEIFHDLVITHHLAQPQQVHLEIERNRLIFSHLDHSTSNPPSMRGGSSSVSRIEHTINFVTETAHFKPDAIIIDGFDFHNATAEAVSDLTKIAKSLDAEMWLSAEVPEYEAIETEHGKEATPAPVKDFYGQLSVVVLLHPVDDVVRISMLKDHENPDVSELHLHLDPTTMRVVDEDLPPQSNEPKDPTVFHLFSGGAHGAEATFGACAEEWGLSETHFSFKGHPFLRRERGVKVLEAPELKKGDFSLVYASHRLGRPLSEIPNIKRILQTTWHQITNAAEVFVIGAIQENGTVKGGTGWGAELARLWSKPVTVFDQVKGQWFSWDSTRWRDEDAPVIRRNHFAGIGTTHLNDKGKRAVRELFERSFGPPPEA